LGKHKGSAESERVSGPRPLAIIGKFRAFSGTEWPFLCWRESDLDRNVIMEGSFMEQGSRSCNNGRGARSTSENICCLFPFIESKQNWVPLVTDKGAPSEQ